MTSSFKYNRQYTVRRRTDESPQHENMLGLFTGHFIIALRFRAGRDLIFMNEAGQTSETNVDAVSVAIVLLVAHPRRRRCRSPWATRDREGLNGFNSGAVRPSVRN